VLEVKATDNAAHILISDFLLFSIGWFLRNWISVNYRPPAQERWSGGFLFESGVGRFLAGVLRPLVPMGRCD
jgi:hypothetical protein